MRKSLALGLCSTCYTLKRQDEEYFGGLRELSRSVTATVVATGHRPGVLRSFYQQGGPYAPEERTFFAAEYL
jgi:hypothetical protein